MNFKLRFTGFEQALADAVEVDHRILEIQEIWLHVLQL